ncbi:MAG: TolC family protein, partial [Pseudomonadota bacterium]
MAKRSETQGSSSLLTKAANALSGLFGSSPVSEQATIDPIATGSIRTTQHGAHHQTGPISDLTKGPATRGSIVYDAGEALGEAAANPPPLMALRNTIKADDDRRHVAHLNPRPVLRRSMTHDARGNPGIRGTRVAVADTVSSALRGSYSAKARLARAEVDRARVRSALTAFLPRITGTAEAGYSGDATTLDYRDNDAVSVGAELTMPLFTSGVNINTYRQARH